MKTCTLCKTQKDLSKFYKDNSKCDGLRSTCKECHDASVKKRLEDQDNKRSSAKYRAEWEAQNKDARREYKSKWLTLDLQENPEKYRKKYSSYYQNNKGKVNAKTRRRQISKLQRTPSWLNVVDMFEIECIYTYCSSLRRVGLLYDVDHIYPLQGKEVSGLHVPLNLRVITSYDNKSKADNLPAPAILAGQCAETTLNLLVLQDWIRSAANNTNP